MAVLKSSWYVMLFFCIIPNLYGSYGDENEETEKSVELLLDLQHLVTGYEHRPNQNDRQKLKNESLDQLKKLIAKVYDELECGYFYIVQLHLKLTGIVLFGNGETIGVPKNIVDYTFTKESTTMIASLLEPKHGRLNELWLIYMYAHKINDFIRRIVVDGSEVSSEDLEGNRRLHDKALTVIEKSVKKWCKKRDNYYNMKSSNWAFAIELPDEERSSFAKGKNTRFFRDNVDVTMNIIQRNVQLLHENFNKNLENKLLHFRITESFYKELLLFEDENACKSFFKEFLAANFVLDDLEFPTGLISLGEYQRLVIGALEVIMLQITLSINTYTDSSDDDLEKQKQFTHDILAKFMDLMALNGDKGFDDIFTSFVKIVEHKSNTNKDSELSDKSFPRFLASVRTDIQRFIKYVTEKQYGLPTIVSKAIDSNHPKTIDQVFNLGKRFVDQIEHVIGKHSIRLVQSFLITFDENILPPE